MRRASRWGRLTKSMQAPARARKAKTVIRSPKASGARRSTGARRRY